MTKHPPEGRIPHPKAADLTMTSDRPCISERGVMVHAGVKVTYLGHIAARAVKVRMEDGSEEVVHPHCFPELR